MNSEARELLAERGSGSAFRPSSILAGLMIAAGLAGVAGSATAAVLAADTADNDPYPASNWQPGDNGGYGFGPWIVLEQGTLGARYLTTRILDGHRSAWGLNGTYAYGRGLGVQLDIGSCRVTAVHGFGNQSFSGFNLKSSSQPGLAAGEVIRFGIHPGAPGYHNGTIQVSTNCGATYLSLDCGWPLGPGDTIEYTITWSATGLWWLDVRKVADGAYAGFLGEMPFPPVEMVGATSCGATLSENLAFDALVLQSYADVLPWLTIRPYPGNRVALWWPAPAYGWHLQQTVSSLPATNWSDIPDPPQPVAGGWQVVLPVVPTPTGTFFRLKK